MIATTSIPNVISMSADMNHPLHFPEPIVLILAAYSLAA
jgi:hypothetical protein